MDTGTLLCGSVAVRWPPRGWMDGWCNLCVLIVLAFINKLSSTCCQSTWKTLCEREREREREREWRHELLRQRPSGGQEDRFENDSGGSEQIPEFGCEWLPTFLLLIVCNCAIASGPIWVIICMDCRNSRILSGVLVKGKVGDAYGVPGQHNCRSCILVRFLVAYEGPAREP